MRVSDAPILDYGFQPIVNWTMQHPADVSSTTGIGASVLSITGSVLNVVTFRLDDVSFDVLTLIAILSQIIALTGCLWLNSLIRRNLKLNTINPMRHVFMPLRLLIVVTMSMLMTFQLILPHDTISWFTIVSNCLWIGCFYFSSCNLPPARPRQYPDKYPSQWRPSDG